MADKADVLVSSGLVRQFFLFTTESAEEAADVITAYKKKAAPKTPGAVKRIK